jgi:hypothetical protein
VVKSSALLPTRSILLTVLALVYAAGASLAAWNIITQTEASTQAIEAILKTYNMQNEGAKSLERFDQAHPFLGMFVSSPLRHTMELPSAAAADEALSTDVRDHLKTVRQKSFEAAWWSWSLLSFSLAYVVLVIALERSFTARGTLFALTSSSLTFFVIGVLAPAMVIWTAPSIPMATGNLDFVIQHQVRGIAAIIRELFTSGHWVIGGFLLLFSIITPLTKASLTYFVTASRSKELNFKVGEFLHTIGKWSMADVFVAGVLLALYALKAQEATKSIPCLGLYYFIGYCLLSMTTTELLAHSGIVAGNEKKARRKLPPGVVVGLFAGLLCYMGLSSLYTYQQYTMNTKEHLNVSSSPQQLNNADLVLPVHKK